MGRQKKVLLMGDSHCAGLYGAFRQGLFAAEAQVDFLFKHGLSMLDQLMVQEDGTITARDGQLSALFKGAVESVVDRIDLGTYDHIVVYGLKLKTTFQIRPGRRPFRTQAGFWGRFKRKKQLQARIRSTPQLEFLGRFPAFVRAKVLSLPTPPWNVAGARSVTGNGGDYRDLTLYESLLAPTVKELGGDYLDLSFLRDETSGLFASRDYKSELGHDMGHVNTRGALLVWQAILRRLGVPFTMTEAAQNPYKLVGQKAFWAPAVGQCGKDEIAGLWSPKIKLTQANRFVTYGSCFAQHFGRALAARGHIWHRCEQAPAELSEADRKHRNYDLFSARTGNIYTATLLKQWLDWAFGLRPVSDEVWERDGRFIDPFRPNLQPEGFASKADLMASRAETLRAFKQSVLEADVFVFTLGLTECWRNRKTGVEYPMCPGTIAGTFEEKVHGFENQPYEEILVALKESLAFIKAQNPGVKFLLTVSPVPLTATMSGNHVLVATTQSKSVLRAVAGRLYDLYEDIDYFPSYEIITAPPFGGVYFAANKRSVTPDGVEKVMSAFFDTLAKWPRWHGEAPEGQKGDPDDMDDDIVCEEAVLAAMNAGR